MKIALIASGLCGIGLVIAIAGSGCGDDDPVAGIPSRSARKGEACQTSNDCAVGLACSPNGSANTGVCVVGTFNIAQTAKECAIVECTTPTDCCDKSTNCEQLRKSCESARDAGVDEEDNFQCESYDEICHCNANKTGCENDLCVTKCAADNDCTRGNPSSSLKCVGGKCVRCVADDDCKAGNPTSDLTCVNGSCKPACKGDGDCPGFERCSTGKCIPGVCQSDRECVARTNNVEAKCVTGGKCIEPCQTDLECGSPTNYRFFSCIAGQCQFVGCDTDKDCSLLRTGGSDGTSGGTGSSGGSTVQRRDVCRPKTAQDTANR